MLVGVVKDYDCDILYHPRKPKVGVNALNCIGSGQLSSLRLMAPELANEMAWSEIE